MSPSNVLYNGMGRCSTHSSCRTHMQKCKAAAAQPQVTRVARQGAVTVPVAPFSHVKPSLGSKRRHSARVQGGVLQAGLPSTD